MRPPSDAARGRALVLCAAVLWGTTGTAQALGPDGADPAAVGALRLVVGGGVLALLAGLRGELGRAGSAPGALMASAVAMAAYQPLFFSGVRTTGVAVGTVVAIGSSPLFAGLLARLLRGERTGRRWAVATVLAVVGCALLVGPGAEGGVNPAGVALALGAGASYALYATAAKGLIERAGVVAASGAAFGVAAVLLSPVLFASEAGPLVSARGAAVVAHLGLVATASAYLLFGAGLKRVPVASAATLSLAEPATAALLGVVLLGERPGPPEAAGMGLLLCGLALAALPGSGSGGRAAPRQAGSLRR